MSNLPFADSVDRRRFLTGAVGVGCCCMGLSSLEQVAEAQNRRGNANPGKYDADTKLTKDKWFRLKLVV